MTRSRLAGPGVMNCRGVTLVELLVVLVILGFVASIAVFAPSAVERPPADEIEAEIALARREAQHSGLGVTLEVVIDGETHLLTSLPDGSVVADTALGLDRLTGRRLQRHGARKRK